MENFHSPEIHPVDLITGTIRSVIGAAATTLVSLKTDPITGLVLSAPLYDFIKALLPGTFEQRTKSFLDTICKKILEHNNQIKNLELKLNSEEFKTFFAKAIIIAMENHQKEKLNALRNAVINNLYDVNIEEDLQLIYLSHIQSLTPSHLKLLKFLSDNIEKLSFLDSYTKIYDEYQTIVSQQINRDTFSALLNRLKQEDLIQISPSITGFADVYEETLMAMLGSNNKNLPLLRITDVGKSFILFISQPISPNQL